MLAEQRRRRILELIQEEGSARVKFLSKVFEVSEPTIRQDLERLEAEDFIIRSHGGAVLKTIPQQVKSLSLQHSENLEKKAAIGRTAAGLVSDDESIILDSGSTATEVARNLLGKQNVRIITNALNIALIVGANPTFEVMVTGGEFKAPTLSLTGEKAATFFSQIHVHKLFLATGGISENDELTYPGLSDIPVKRAMIRSAGEVYLVADSTKIGVHSFASLGGIEQVHYLITDSGISPEARGRFERKGVKVIIADQGGASHE
ncbi:MAG TPA: DeoR/GlpR family DNA-binding transcription regulator [Spirochaetia bacterium]|nr:DeoR/GlpR family DNA-binding transcription regulator [Spirochaetia bacterium]